MDFCEIRITAEPIPPSPPLEDVPCGAIVDFHGVVRPLENGASIAGIEYSFHPRMTEPTLRNLVAAVAGRFPLLGCRLIHRVGFVAAGETSLFLRVATAHREAAYSASRELIEELKRSAPIWKNPVRTGSPALG